MQLLKFNKILFVIFIIAFVSGCGNNRHTASKWTQGVYAEFGNLNAFSSALPLLKQTNTALMLGVYPDDIGSAKLLTLLNQASREGVMVKLWPMLPKNEGVWPNEDNVDSFSQEVKNLISWLNTNNIKNKWLIFDMEPPYALTISMSTAAKSGNGFSALSILIAYMSPTTYNYAYRGFEDLIQYVHKNGWKVEAVTYPLVLDDLVAGSSNLQMLFHIPIHGLDWDLVSFMVYQSSIKELLGKDYGSSIIASYSSDAHRFYGNNAVVALGVIGNDPISGIPGYTDTAGLFNDISAALGEGISHIEIYSLGEILSQSDPPAWLETSGIKPAVIPINSDVRNIRALIQGFAKGLHPEDTTLRTAGNK